MASFIDLNGATQQVKLDASIYRAAYDAGVSVEAYVNQTYPVAAGAVSAFDQMCASEGIIIGANRKYGIRPATMDAILNGAPKMEAGTIVRDASPASRILFPAVILSAIENKLVADRSSEVAGFTSSIAVDDVINGDKFERPVLNFTRPEGAVSRAIAQLSEPTSMLSITVSDTSKRITGESLGMEISDQAIKATSLDLVTLAFTRQALIAAAAKVDAYWLAFLNGDTDLGTSALSATTAASLDAAATSGITQKAWIKWFATNATKRTITDIVTDVDGAIAIAGRANRPVITSDNPTSPRIDTLEQIVNPIWPASVNVHITTDSNWPAKTLLGFDRNYAIHRVTSLSLQYEASEAYAMRRSTKFRADSGQIAYRLFDDAWSCMTYA